MKKVWITSLNRDPAAVSQLMADLKKYGVQPDGHFWMDDLENMAWTGPLEELTGADTGLWVIVGSAEDFQAESVRYGLAVLALAVQSRRGHGFPLLVAAAGDAPIEPDSLPTPLRGADLRPLGGAGLGAKVVARANMPIKPVPVEYRLDITGVPRIGQWVEVGPAAGETWEGVLFGVKDAEIDAHGVGRAGEIPERCVLEYPMQGLELALCESRYTAWAVQNRLSDADSYFLRVKGHPASIVFGPLPGGDEGELFTVDLK